MQKPAWSSSLVFGSLAAVLVIGLVLVACEGSGPTAPETTVPTRALSDAPQDPLAGDPGSQMFFAIGAKAPKVDVCHVDDESGETHIININENALGAHLGHGDNVVGPEECDEVDNDCNGEVDDGGVCAAECPCDGLSVGLFTWDDTFEATAFVDCGELGGSWMIANEERANPFALGQLVAGNDFCLVFDISVGVNRVDYPFLGGESVACRESLATIINNDGVFSCTP